AVVDERAVLGLALAQGLLGALAVVDPGGGAVPADDPARRVAQRVPPGEEPLVVPIRGAEPVLDLEVLPGAPRLVPAGGAGVAVVGVDYGPRGTGQEGLRRETRVPEDHRVAVVDAPLGPRRPDELREHLGEDLQPRLPVVERLFRLHDLLK